MVVETSECPSNSQLSEKIKREFCKGLRQLLMVSAPIELISAQPTVVVLRRQQSMFHKRALQSMPLTHW